MNILHIESSPRGAGSNSIALTTAFVESCRAADPSLVVDRLNVWEEDLPDFGQKAIGAKYKAVRNADMTDREAEVWACIQSLIARFRQADRIVLGAPMWYFSIPYKLKHLIDLVAQRSFLFTYDGKRYGPALQVAKGVAVYTRGSRYLEGTPITPSRFEHQASYLDFWLELVGVKNLRSVVVDSARNQDDEESARAAAEGRTELVALTDWFLARQFP